MPVYTIPQDLSALVKDVFETRVAKTLSRRTDPATSKQAASNLVKSGAHKSQCDRVYDVLNRFKTNGATPNEISALCGLDHYAVYKRLNDLKLRGYAFKTVATRENQAVWTAND